jgi:hypothetical protein
MNVPLPLIVVLLVNSWKECIAQSLYEMIGVNLFLQIAAGEFARRANHPGYFSGERSMRRSGAIGAARSAKLCFFPVS